MKKLTFVIIILILMTKVAWGENTSPRGLNGRDWFDLSGAHRILWVNGLIAGSNSAIINYSLPDIKPSLKTADNYNKLEDKIFNHNSEKLGIWRISAEQLVNAMNEFYIDYRNKSIAMVDAIYVARMEIQGKKPELIEAQKRYLRMQPFDYRYKLSGEGVKPEKIMRRRGFKDKTIKEIQETFFRFGIYAEPKVTKPTELEDYNFIPLFVYGKYQ